MIEMVVATAITLIAASLIYAIYATGQEAWDIKNVQADLQSYGRLAMSRMAQELRSATRTSTQVPSPDLVIPASPNNKQIDFYLPADMDSNGYITNATGAVEWDTNATARIEYIFVSGSNTLERLHNGTTETMARNVTDARFIDQSIDATLYQDELKILLALAKTTKRQRTITMNFTGMVKLRN
jgi:Tfp pilus assembly protein PilW